MNIVYTSLRVPYSNFSTNEINNIEKIKTAVKLEIIYHKEKMNVVSKTSRIGHQRELKTRLRTRIISKMVSYFECPIILTTSLCLYA